MNLNAHLNEKFSRREFVQKSGTTLTGLLLMNDFYQKHTSDTTIEAIVFDGFSIFNPLPVFKRVHDLFPQKGEQLIETWKSKQFSYQWLRACANQYKDFWEITRDTLEFAAATCHLQLTNAEKYSILNEYRTINTWPDVIPALLRLKNEGRKLCILSNMTAAMLNKGIQNANIKGVFDAVISTDSARTFKPSQVAYKMAIDVLQLEKQKILYAPFAGWDVAGGKWFGYPTYWVNRLNAPRERLDVISDEMGKDLNDLSTWVSLNR